MILKTSELTVYFRSRDIFLCIMTQFLNFAFKWASKNIWCLAVWCAVIVWNSTPSDIKWQSLWRWLFFPIQTLRSMFLASVDGANAGGYCSRHIMKLMFPLCSCLLAVFCLFVCLLLSIICTVRCALTVWSWLVVLSHWLEASFQLLQLSNLVQSRALGRRYLWSSHVTKPNVIYSVKNPSDPMVEAFFMFMSYVSSSV